jgi:hypothetical protein
MIILWSRAVMLFCWLVSLFLLAGALNLIWPNLLVSKAASAMFLVIAGPLAAIPSTFVAEVFHRKIAAFRNGRLARPEQR